AYLSRRSLGRQPARPRRRYSGRTAGPRSRRRSRPDGEVVQGTRMNLSCRRVAPWLAAALLALTACSPPRPDHPVIGAKNFTEQVILGELLAQQIEAHSHLKVERRVYLAGSYICHQALVAGRIDAYVEYTGTALTGILKQPVDRSPKWVLKTVRSL